MNLLQNYYIYLSQVVDISLRIVAKEEQKREEFEKKLLELLFSSIFAALENKISQSEIEEITKQISPKLTFQENLAFLLNKLSEKVGAENLESILNAELEKFAKKVVEITHKSLTTEASKEYDIQLAKLGQAFIDA